MALVPWLIHIQAKNYFIIYLIIKIMVTVTRHFQREDAEGKEYSMLELSGDMEIVYSKKTNRPYATAKRCYMPATFPEEVCNGLLGKQLPGTIKKVDCEAYNYTIPETEEVIELTYRWQYAEEETNLEAAVFGTVATKKPSVVKVK